MFASTHCRAFRRELFRIALTSLLAPLVFCAAASASEGEAIDYRVSRTAPTLIVLAQASPDENSFQQAVTLRADLRGGHDGGFKPIGAVGADIRPAVGEMPADYAAARFARVGEIRQGLGATRDWGLYNFNWEAKALCHRSLLFEEVNLERYGYSLGPVQPAVSAAHFFATIPLLPYKVTAERARQCHYTLGHYRPGSYAPFRYNRTPLRLGAAWVEGGVATGLFFLIP